MLTVYDKLTSLCKIINEWMPVNVQCKWNSLLRWDLSKYPLRPFMLNYGNFMDNNMISEWGERPMNTDYTSTII